MRWFCRSCELCPFRVPGCCPVSAAPTTIFTKSSARTLPVGVAEFPLCCPPCAFAAGVLLCLRDCFCASKAAAAELRASMSAEAASAGAWACAGESAPCGLAFLVGRRGVPGSSEGPAPICVGLCIAACELPFLAFSAEPVSDTASCQWRHDQWSNQGREGNLKITPCLC